MDKQEKMEVITYHAESGREPIYEFLSARPAKHLEKILRDIDLLGQCSRNLREPYAKHLTGPLWELRTKFSTNIYRIIYYIKGGQIVLLHGFVKKTEETPPGEIKIAKRRYKDWEERA